MKLDIIVNQIYKSRRKKNDPLYNKRKELKKVGHAEVNSLKIKGSGQKSNFSKRLPDSTGIVKQKSARDTEYLNAVKSKNMKTAQKLVDEAAKNAEYTVRMWHSSKKDGGFTQFRDWAYFTENKAYAERYAERDNAASLYESYIKLKLARV